MVYVQESLFCLQLGSGDALTPVIDASAQIRHSAQALVTATVYSCLAAVFDIFEIGSLQ